jgi:hypothetical protein
MVVAGFSLRSILRKLKFAATIFLWHHCKMFTLRIASKPENDYYMCECYRETLTISCIIRNREFKK